MSLTAKERRTRIDIRPQGLQKPQSGDEEGEDESLTPLDTFNDTEVRKARDQLSISDESLLFGIRGTGTDLSALHPEQVQILRLWQIYLENINPLLKVTHTPTLQARIIDAASDVSNISPSVEALMFSIYCVAIISLTEEETQSMLQSSKKDLLTTFKFGCQQALLNSEYMRSTDRDTLTALFLYLASPQHSRFASLLTFAGISLA